MSVSVRLSVVVGLSAVGESCSEVYCPCPHDLQSPATAGHHASMLRKIVRRPTAENFFLNWAVVAFGARHQNVTPFNSCIADLIRFRESLSTW